ncbi:DUF1128 domain-containing protein [Ferviditalea candida]|uniref:UPF0435 protein VF724_11055 n=1 Tax=Ferviditalea candida TaxID=3108399 RepID=A0ABU5ZI82_9BACL|nr:DUF1128 domain-containing protein [Paenibacillaceae bacterium T2]
MDLTKKNEENMAFMIEQIKKKLKVVSVSAIRPEHFDVELYEDIKDIFEVVMEKDNFSISEVEAIASELGRLRKI